MVSSAVFTVVKVLASLSSMALCLSPLPSTLTIHRKQNTGDVVLLPLVAFWVNCHLWMLYGYVTSAIFPLTVTYAFGDLMSLVYMGVFVRYTFNRPAAVKIIVPALLVVAMTTVYAVLGTQGSLHQSQHAVEQVFGYITTVGSVLMYTSPLATVRRVLQTKNGASIPFGLCLAGTVSNTLWIIYGAMDGDMFVFGLGVFCAVFALLQVVLYLVYRPQQSDQELEDKDTDKQRELVISVATETSDAENAAYISMQSPRQA